MDAAHTRLAIWCSVGALLGGLVLAYLFPFGAEPGHEAGGLQDGDTEISVTSGTFRILGISSEPISPGVTASLDLVFSNPEAYSMEVSGLTVTVNAVDAPNADARHPCSTEDFAIDQAPGTLKIRVAAGARSSLSSLNVLLASWPRVGMANRTVNQDGCKSATLSLTYSASGAPAP